ncbi:ATP-binding protein [Patescibacteria group bacterium]
MPLTINISVVILVASIANLLLGIFVWKSNPKKPANRAFGVFAFLTALWGVNNFLLRMFPDPLIIRNSYAIGALIPIPALFWFFIFWEEKFNKLKKIIFFSASTVFFTLCYVNGLIFVDLHEVYDLGYKGDTGILFPLYALYLLGVSVFIVYKTISAQKKKKGTKKTQLKYMLVGFIAYVSIVLFVSFVLPLFGVLKFTALDSPSSLIFLLFTSYAISRYHLFNIKVIATEILGTSLSIILLIDALFSKTTTEFLLKFILFLIVLFFSRLLVKSVLGEIQSKEEVLKLATDLKQANIELRRLDKTKSEFLSIASHQLRSPITAIKGYSSLILEGEFGKTPRKLKTVVEKIFHSSKRISFMVDDFLDISRIETGKMQYNFTEFDLKKMTLGIIKDLKTNNRKAKKLKITFSHKNNEKYLIKADQNKINQVVSNILDNSAKYTSEGYIKISLTSNTESNTVLIKIADSGIGIARNDMYRIFGKFTRAEDVSKLYTDGSGLGLYVAKRIIQAHHGKIWAESGGKGEGSVFSIELPVSQ